MPKEMRSRATRKAILDAAAHCFAQRGYAASGVSEICREAGVSKGAFYHHFESKQEVFLQLLEAWVEGLDERLSQLNEASGGARAGLLAMVDVLPAVLSSGEDQLRMYLEFWTQAIRERPVWERLIRPFHSFTAFFSQIVDRGVAEGQFGPVDGTVAARVLIAFAIGVLVSGLLDREDETWDRVAQQGVSFITRGMSIMEEE